MDFQFQKVAAPFNFFTHTPIRILKILKLLVNNLTKKMSQKLSFLIFLKIFRVSVPVPFCFL